jgi:hypothetical protein
MQMNGRKLCINLLILAIKSTFYSV